MSWVIRLPHHTPPRRLARAWQCEGVEVACSEDPAALWLRMGEKGGNRDLSLPGLAEATVYQWPQEGRELVPRGKRLPVARLPEGLRWKALRDWLRLRVGTPLLAGRLDAGRPQVPLRLVRSSSPPLDADLWVSSLSALTRYAVTAPEVRLQGLRLAVSGDGRAIIRGGPSLPLPGVGYALEGGLAVPLGWRLSLPLSGEAVGRWLGLAPREVALMHPEGEFERVHASDFVDLTRSAVRLTWERFQSAGRGEEEA